MMTKKEAQAYADMMGRMKGEPYAVFKTPDNAKINQHPANLYNSGRYWACRASEREEYEAGGAIFDSTNCP
jgi:hypothetical protein